jgi:hypothetical protein
MTGTTTSQLGLDADVSKAGGLSDGSPGFPPAQVDRRKPIIEGAPGQGTTVLAALGTLAKLVETDELIRRIEALENANGKNGHPQPRP